MANSHCDHIGFKRHLGAYYQNCLSWIHERMKPESYLEIGTSSGSTLTLAGGVSIAVDPMFQITADVMGHKSALHMFQKTSDEFFKARHLEDLIKRPLSCVFLDGLHLSEFLLRDFINVELYCDKHSIVVMHDCLPLDWPMAVRDANSELRATSIEPSWWTGDVWKVLGVLREHRPDLIVECYDAPPTGLVVVRNLDPSSRRLSESYAEIAASLGDESGDKARLADFASATDILSTDRLSDLINELSQIGRRPYYSD